MCLVANEIANGVGRFSLQMASFNIQDAIPESGNVKAQGMPADGLFSMNFIFSQPAESRKGELHFVSVTQGRGGGNDGAHVITKDVAVAPELVVNLLTLCLGLCFVVHLLPRASAAHGSVLADRFDAQV